MKKSIEFIKWIANNTIPCAFPNQIYYKDRNDLKELYQIYFKETFNK